MPEVSQELYKRLEECTYANTPKFNFDNKVFKAKCVKVYDGDTITVVFVVFGEYYRFSVRMNGYDTPELKNAKDPLEKKYAKKARQLLSDMVLHRIVILKCMPFSDKYGRILGEVELNGASVNQIMLCSEYARVYAGGRKEPWDFTELEKNNAAPAPALALETAPNLDP
jgi:endonuclease YncB( thermonuclease family)